MKVELQEKLPNKEEVNQNAGQCWLHQLSSNFVQILIVKVTKYMKVDETRIKVDVVSINLHSGLPLLYSTISPVAPPSCFKFSFAGLLIASILSSVGSFFSIAQVLLHLSPFSILN